MHIPARCRDLLPPVEDGNPGLARRHLSPAETTANERSGWSFSRKSATTQLLRYFDGDARDKRKVYERFEDANFHNLNRALESGDPVELRRQMNDIFDNTAPNKQEKELFRRLGLNIR